MIMKIEGLKSKKWIRVLAIAMTLAFVLGGAVTAYAASNVEVTKGLVVANDASLQPQEIQTLGFNESSQIALPKDSTVIGLETTSVSDSIITPMATFSVATTNLKPGYYTKSSSSYYVVGGSDKLGYNVVWSPAGNKIQVGLIPINDNSTQYVVTLSGGSGSGTLTTNNVPNGDYYVVIINPSSNSSNISSVTGNFEWK